MTEEWRTIPEFPKYEIRRDGKVRNKRTQKIRLYSYNGTAFLTLMGVGKRTSRTVNQLLRNAFPDEGF